jgi:hypothetical protein
MLSLVASPREERATRSVSSERSVELVAYLSLRYSRSENLGDEIQSLAAEQFLPHIDGFVDRDVELHQVSSSAFVFLNGWFKCGPTHWRDGAEFGWPPSKRVHPGFIGFHIEYPTLLAPDHIEYYRAWAPIGCRDIGTVEMLEDKGVKAYFSRCLTLTFPRRSDPSEGDRVYVVHSKRSKLTAAIPKRLLKDAEMRSHYIEPNLCSENDIKREMAASLLAEYRESARLVVTDLLHCAMPCIAMGVPVVFFSPYERGDPEAYRLDPIRDLIPVYHLGDDVDWSPDPPDTSTIASELRQRAGAMVGSYCRESGQDMA